jgi:hypothetical protein
MALDVTGLLDTLPMMLSAMPMLFQAMEVIGYVFLIFFFGSIAVKGIRSRMSFIFRFFLRISFGFLCIISASVLEPFLPFGGGIFQLFQVNLMVAGVISGAVFAAGLYMLTYGMTPAIHDITSKMQVMARQLERIEGVLKKRKMLKQLTDKEAMSKAKKHIKQDFKALNADLRDDIWKVRLVNKKGNKAMVLVDSYSGEIKDVMRGLRIHLDPVKVIGIAIIAAFAVYAFTSFTGLPSFSENFFSFMGISEDDFNQLTQALGGGTASQGCPNTLGVLQKFNDDMTTGNLVEYNSAETRNLVEAEGYTVDRMYRVTYSGSQYIVALTTDFTFCIATQTAVCQCINTQELLG